MKKKKVSLEVLKIASFKTSALKPAEEDQLKGGSSGNNSVVNICIA